MAFIQRPCACGGTTFQVLPDVQIHYGGTSTLATTHVWGVIAVVCTTCTRTELYTNNADQIATHVRGSRIIEAGAQ